MPKPDGIAAVVFDIGETLIDETRIWSRWADRLNVPRFTLMGILGGLAAQDRPHQEVFHLLRPGFELAAELERWRLEEPESLRENFDEEDLYPDVRECLAALQQAGIKVLIAGNQPRQAKVALETMALPVDAILVSEELGVEKPDRAFFDVVIAEAGSAPHEILVVGDRLDNDVVPARAAGMRTVLLRRGPWGYLHAERPEAAIADFVTNSLAEVTVFARKH